MAGLNPYIGHGSSNEQYLLEDLIIESLSIYGQKVFYIPRTLVNKDEIFGEDTLSQFKSSFPIEMYFENVESFDGQGPFIQKFGLFMEQSATLVVARRRWNQLVGQFGQTVIPGRPNEGDLIYFPLTNGLFEIKFVQHQDPFYQLGKLYTYKLNVELFQYASEKLDTGIPEIDAFETLKSFDTDPAVTDSFYVRSLTITNVGAGYTTAPNITFSGGNPVRTATARCTIDPVTGSINAIEITDTGKGYDSAPTITIDPAPAGGTNATGTAEIEMNVDGQDGFGDNTSIKLDRDDDGKRPAWSEDNPFGTF